MTQQTRSRNIPVARSAYDHHASAITVLMNMMFVRQFIRVYRKFDGDFVAAIVLGEVAHHNLSHLVNRSRTPQELSEALRTVRAKRPESLLPTNAFSIGEATGIPRETVRRKIAALLRRGWLTKDGEGNLFVSGSVSEAFADQNFESLHDLLEAARAIEALLEDVQAPAERRHEPPRSRSGRKPAAPR